MGGTARPVGSWPSATAAIKDLLAQGKSRAEIKGALAAFGVPAGTISGLLAQIQNPSVASTEKPARPSKPKSATPDTRGIWTPEKLDKARRLFGKTMIYIAQALQVPADELLQYGLKGVIPPMGKTQRIAALLEDLSRDAPAPTAAAAPAPSERAGPETLDHIEADVDARAADEAELAALDEAEDVEFVELPVDALDNIPAEPDPAQQVDEIDVPKPAQALRRPESLFDELREVAAARATPVVPAPPQVAGTADPLAVPMAAQRRTWFTLRNEAGEYLHEDGRRMTRVERFRGRFTADELRKLRRQKPALRQLIEEVA